MTKEKSYEDLLKGSWGEIPEVKLLPVGTYLLRCRNVSFVAPKTDEGNPAVMFVYEVREAMDDVDQDALDELGSDYNVSENQIFERIWLERGADWDKLRKHILKHGIVEADIADMSPDASFKLVKGKDVYGLVTQRQFKDKAGASRVENAVSAFTALDE